MLYIEFLSHLSTRSLALVYTGLKKDLLYFDEIYLTAHPTIADVEEFNRVPLVSNTMDVLLDVVDLLWERGPVDL